MDKDGVEKKEIICELDSLGGSADELLKRIKTLGERLSEVMKPIDSESPPEAIKVVREILSPMGQRIQRTTNIIDESIDTVETMKRHLEI